MRSSRPLAVLVVLVCVLLSSCSLTARQGLGSPEADLAAMNAALDTTISEARLHVRSRAPGTANAPCVDSGGQVGGTHAASDSLVVDLAGEDAVAVSHRVEEVWRRHADEWFGGGLTVEPTMEPPARSARVDMAKGGWIIEADVPFNSDLGPYVMDASAPCY